MDFGFGGLGRERLADSLAGRVCEVAVKQMFYHKNRDARSVLVQDE